MRSIRDCSKSRLGGSSQVAVVFLAAILFASGCRRTESVPVPTTLRLAVRGDVTGIFPNAPIGNESHTLHVNSNVFEGLVRFDRRLEPTPALAEYWENPDDRTYLFVLRPGLRFSDGRPVTARDVAQSLTAATSRAWVTRDYLQAVESVRAIGPDRVEIRTQFPYPMLLSRLFWGFVLPADVLERNPVPPVGTGPYRVESWTPGRELVLLRNPLYRGPSPAFSQARFVVVPEAEARVKRLLSGEADLVDQVPPEMISSLEARSDVQVVVRPSLRVLFLVLRVGTPPFSDPRVREAIDLAIDREELIRRALAGRGEPASQLVPRAVVGFNPRITPTQPDRERARRLLAEAGYGRGLRLRLDGTNNRYVNDTLILGELARQLGEVGIDVQVNAQDKAVAIPAMLAGQSSFHLFGWACESGDAGDALDALLHSPDAGQLGSVNTSGLADVGLDRLIDEGHNSRSRALRTTRIQEALAWIARKRPVIPLVVQTEALAFSRRLQWDPPLNLALRLEEMSPTR